MATAVQQTNNEFGIIRKDVVAARDVVFDELPASQPAVLTSEPAYYIDEIEVLSIPTFSTPSPTSSDDSIVVITTTAVVGDNGDKLAEEEYISTALEISDSVIIEGPWKGKGQGEIRYDEIDWSKRAMTETAACQNNSGI